MAVHTARVRKGRLVLDEPTELPEDAQVPLFDANPFEHLDAFDDLEDEARAALEAALDRGWDAIEAGHGLTLQKAVRNPSAR
jgi:hypothetical protein